MNGEPLTSLNEKMTGENLQFGKINLIAPWEVQVTAGKYGGKETIFLSWGFPNK